MSRNDDEDPKLTELIPESSESPPETDGGTRVDMGDDLLEKTAVLVMPGAHAHPTPAPAPAPAPVHTISSPHQSIAPEPEPLSPGPIGPEQIADHMQSARILMGEGILEDAKRILRRILLTDPSRLEARRMLDEGVVVAAEDLDLAMITGAGFSFWNGGLTMLLEREGLGSFH